MLSISKKIKNIFNNKIVLYSVIAVTVIAIGIVVWGAVTDWKFWNAQKSSQKSSQKSKQFGPNNLIHNCGRYCQKCNDTGNCEECVKSEHIHRVGKYCIKDDSHPCGETCDKCNNDGKTCVKCINGTKPDSKGRCCSDDEKVNGECCKKCGETCCDSGKVCTSNGFNVKCCDPGSTLDKNGDCCTEGDKTDDGICCTDQNGTKCGRDGETFCCMHQGGNSKCVDDKCELTCNGDTCTDKQDCINDDGTKKCENKECEWDKDVPAYYPGIQDVNIELLTDSKQCKGDTAILKGNTCQFHPYGIINENTRRDIAARNRNTVMKKDKLKNNITFLFPSSDINGYSFSKITAETSKNAKDKNLLCNNDECKARLGNIPQSSTILFDTVTGTCVAEEQPDKEISPSATTKCPFKDTTKCCMNENGHWTGQVCLSDDKQQCIYDKKTGLGTCGYKCDNCQSGMGLYFDGKGSQYLTLSKCDKGECKCLNPDGTPSTKGGSKWMDHTILSNEDINPKQVGIDSGIENKNLNMCTLCVPDGTSISTLTNDSYYPKLTLEKCGNGTLGCCSGICHLNIYKELTCGCKCDSDCPSGYMCDGSSCIEKTNKDCWVPGTGYFPGFGSNCCHDGGFAECPDANDNCP